MPRKEFSFHEWRDQTADVILQRIAQIEQELIELRPLAKVFVNGHGKAKKGRAKPNGSVGTRRSTKHLPNGTARPIVVAVFKRTATPMRMPDLQKVTKLGGSTIFSVLRQLVNEGIVKKVAMGTYQRKEA